MKNATRFFNKLLLTSAMLASGCGETPSGSKPTQDPPDIKEFSVMEDSAPARADNDQQD